MKSFKNIFLWALNMKLYMSLYFAAITLLLSLTNFCFGVDNIGFLTILQVLGVSIVVAFMQVTLLPDITDFSKGIFFPKSLIWLVISGAVIGTVSYFGNWFSALPSYTSWIFAVVMMIGCAMMLFAFQFEQERDTKILNENLKNYKNTL